MNKNQTPIRFSETEVNANWDSVNNKWAYRPKEYKIREDPIMPPNCTISVYGKRGTGKSFWVRWHLYNHRDIFPWGWVFTKTKNNRFYESFIPKEKILGPYTPYNLNKIIERQLSMQSAYLKFGDINPLAFVVWDDALGDEVKYDNTLATYYFNSRHFHTHNIMTAQHVTGTPPPVRQNTDYAVMFKNFYSKALEHLNDDFSREKDKELFMRDLDKYTNDNNFLMINNDPNVGIENYRYYGKAEEPPAFVMGCEQYWRNSLDQYDDIFTGKIQEKMDRIKDMSDINKVVKLFSISKPGRMDDRI